jgi:hypothetical protein
MAKPKDVFAQARALARKLAAIDRRAEAAHIKLESAHVELQQRFDDEREAAMRGVDDAVLRCLEASRPTVGAP